MGIYRQLTNGLGRALRTRAGTRPTSPEGMESALREVDEGVAPATGGRFFTALVSQLARCLGTDYALVGTLDPAHAGRLTTLAVCGGGRIADNFTYDLLGTPCENVLQRGPCVYANSVRKQFPDDLLLHQMGVESYVGTWLVDAADRPIGVLAVLHGAPMPNPDLADAILRLFAPRAAAEFERMRAEEALRTSEEKLSKVFSSSPDAITLSSVADGRFADVNQGFTRTFGYSREDAVGRSALELELWRSPERRREFVGWLAQHGSVRNMEAELVTRSGATRTCLISADVIEIQGRAWMLAVTRDITDRKEADEALRSSERRYRALFQQSQALNLVVDRDARLVDVNDAVTRTFDIGREQLVGRSALDFIAPGDRERVASAIASIFRGAPAVPFHVHVVTREGPRILMLALGGLDDSSGQATMLVNALDVTAWHGAERERERLEEHLHQSQKMEAIGRLAGGVAHDFNNILHAVQGNLILALDELPAGTPAVSEVSEALVAVGRAASLTRQLLTFSRRDPVQPRPIDVAREVASMATMLGRVIGEHITLAVTGSRDLPPVRIDRSQLEQIVLNLCVNARDAMPAGGRLDLDTRTVRVPSETYAAHPGSTEGTFLCLTVSDTGAGIPPELLPRIFEPFFTTKEAGRGTGLGLATVYAIVHRYGGFIDVASRVDAGTTFRICLPVVTGSVDYGETPAGAEGPSGGSETILVAEDDRAVRELVSRTLARAGYRVLAAADGLEALALFEAHGAGIELAVLDAVMPGAGGGKVFRAMILVNPDRPVLFTTGYADDAFESADAADRPLDAGRDAARGRPIILKPYAPQELLWKVRELLDEARARRSAN